MWALKSTKDGGSKSHNFVVGVEYTVGRKSADVLLADDQSVSRKHAILQVVHAVENLTDKSSPSVLSMKDLSSKYGTFHKSNRLASGEEVVLQNGDIVRFGVFESEFQVCYSPLVVTTSCIQAEQKRELKAVLHKLGGHLVSEWNPSCTHLVMSEVKITVKALCCLVSMKPLVLPQYILELCNSIEVKASLPETTAHLPPSGEPMIDKEKVSFDIMPSRKTLFGNKTFIFLDECQMKKLNLAITVAGGHTLLLNPNQSINADTLTSINTCVVQPQGDIITKDEAFAEFYRKLTATLSKQKKRLIPESEFGLAVAYCSTERFCNPNFNSGLLLGGPNVQSQTFSQEEVYVANTESSCLERRSTLRKMCFRNESNSAEAGASASSMNAPLQTKVKRKICITPSEEDSPVRNPPKKLKEDTLHHKETSIEIEGKSLNQRPSPNVSTISQDIQNIVNSKKCSAGENSLGLASSSNSTRISSNGSNSASSSSTSRRNQNIKKHEVTTTTTATTTAVRETTSHLSNGVNNLNSNVSGENETNAAEDLPRNLIKVKLVDLVKQLAPAPVILADLGNVVNFKKFRKVIHAGLETAQVIGKSALTVYNSNSPSKDRDVWRQDNAVTEARVDSLSQDNGEFDWESQSNSRRRRRR